MITSEKAQQMFFFGEMVGGKRVAKLATSAFTDVLSIMMQENNSFSYFVKRKKEEHDEIDKGFLAAKTAFVELLKGQKTDTQTELSIPTK